MQLYLGGFTCEHEATAQANLARLDLPAPPELKYANTILNPLGECPAKGWLLLTREDLDELDLNGSHDVVLIDDDRRTGEELRRLTLSGMVIVNAECVIPNVQGQIEALYLVEVADMRHLVANPIFHKPVAEQYNVRAPGWGGAYYADTTASGGGTAHTWTQMVEDLWGRVSGQLGAYPGLPFTPHGTPEGWKFPGCSAWAAICQVLRRIGCAVRWKVVASSDGKSATASTYDIVRVGSTDVAAEALVTTAEDDGRLLLDRDPREPVKGKLPYGARIFFHRLEEHRGTEQETQKSSAQWSTTTPYTIDVNGDATVTASAEAGTFHEIWDDLPAIYDTAGTITNSSTLSARATERGADYFRVWGLTRLRKVFSGLVLVGPASVFSGVRWGQTADFGGMTTEIVRVPGGELMADDRGCWKACARSAPIQAPDFGPTWPTYPDLHQIIELDSLTPSSGLYSATVQRLTNPTAPTWADLEAVLFRPANDVAPTALDRIPARLVSFNGTKPVYAGVAPVTAGGSSTFSGARLHIIPSYTGTTTPIGGWNTNFFTYPSWANGYDTGSYRGSSVMTVPSNGKYEVGAQLVLLTVSSVARSESLFLFIYQRRSGVIITSVAIAKLPFTQFSNFGPGTELSIQCHGPAEALTNDTFEAWFIESYAGSHVISPFANQSIFWITRLGN